MIQIQNGRFFYNWLGTPGTEYPTYESVRPEFDDQWEKFRGFVLSNSDESVVQPNQWEILYVNRFPQGSVWNELSDLPQLLTFLHQPDFDELNLEPDGIGGEWRFEILPNKGRLYVKLGLTMKKPDKKQNESPCVVMTLTARGPVGGSTPTLDEGLELGHKTITNAFDCLTSADAKKIWGVQHVNS